MEYSEELKETVLRKALSRESTQEALAEEFGIGRYESAFAWRVAHGSCNRPRANVKEHLETQHVDLLVKLIRVVTYW